MKEEISEENKKELEIANEFGKMCFTFFAEKDLSFPVGLSTSLYLLKGILLPKGVPVKYVKSIFECFLKDYSISLTEMEKHD